MTNKGFSPIFEKCFVLVLKLIMIRLNKILSLIISLAVFIFFFKILIKLLPLILFGALILMFPYRKLTEKLSQMLGNNRDFESIPGQTYKQCRYCQKKAARKALTCDFCGRTFE